MVVYAAAGMGATFGGPAGVLISLGVENVLSNLTQIVFIYNIFSMFTLFVLAIASSQRDTKFMSIIIPLWAGLCMLAGWLKYPNQGTGFGILVVCAMIAIMTYMQETVHERFGIAGPGNKIIKIFTFLIILQCTVVFVNSAQIFPSDVQTLAASNSQYSNIDLTTEMGNLSNSGGILGAIVDIATQSLQIAIAALLLMLKCLLSIALFSVVLSQVFPWILQAGAIGVAFLILMQFAIWTMYVIFIFSTFYRPGPDPGW
jgi:hypothetical protein